MENQVIGAGSDYSPPQVAENITAVPVVKYAGFWVRVAASIIDGVLLFVLLFLLKLLLGDGISDQLISVLVGWGYAVIMIGKYQATLGKMAVGLRVEHIDGSEIGYGRAALREIVGKFISAIILGIGFLMVAFTKKKQGLHDFIADTAVIEKDPTKKKTAWIVIAVVFVLAIPIVGIFSSIILASLNVARIKGQDAYVLSYLATQQTQAEIFYDGNGNSYAGFQPAVLTGNLPEQCNVPPTFNASTDGQQYALFAKSCDPANTAENNYYCVDTNPNSPQKSVPQLVSSSLATSNASTCQSSGAVASASGSGDFIANSTLYNVDHLNISYPNDWTAKKPTNDQTVQVQFLPNDGSQGFVEIREISNSKSMSLNDIVSELKKSYDVQIDSDATYSVPLLDNDFRQIDTVPAEVVTGRFTAKNGLLAHEDNAALIHKGMIYIVTADAVDTEWGKFEPIFKNIIDSITLK